MKTCPIAAIESGGEHLGSIRCVVLSLTVCSCFAISKKAIFSSCLNPNSTIATALFWTVRKFKPTTRVEGLSAKPIIDIMVGVNDLKEVDEFNEPLNKIGYEHVYHQEFSNRRFFRKGQWRAGTHHLHIYKYGSEEWNNNILFRNYLRTHPDVLKQYNELKKHLAEKYRNDRKAYTNAKHPFISTIIEQAKMETRNK